MDYFHILNLKREPFSNSPDPELFYQSRQHVACLQQLELALRLRRGLNVVIGDVGTGKTTLCRQLIRRFAEEEDIETHLILDPQFHTAGEFLAATADMLTGKRPLEDASEYQVKETIKNSLFKKGVEENKTTILIIDEGQKIPDFCLELLREFLNYETNDQKLLQIVLFAQKEFDNTLHTHPNFGDRINLYHVLSPLNFRDTRLMIQHRIVQSSTSSDTRPVFSLPALWAIYLATGGYPRKIVTLCHRSILTMIIQNRSRAGWRLVRSCANRIFTGKRKLEPQAKGAILVFCFAMIAVVSLAYWYHPRNRPVTQIKADHREAPARSEERREPVPAEEPVDPLSQNGPVEAERVVISKAETLKDVREAPPPPVSPPVRETDTDVSPPDSLGTIIVERWETMGGLIQKVYGEPTPQRLDSILSANPHISNPDTLEIGDRIAFPADPVTFGGRTEGTRWIRLGEKKSLAEAVDDLRDYPEKSGPLRTVPMRLIPYWTKEDGLAVSILYGRIHPNHAAALASIGRLPQDLEQKAEIISAWDQSAIYYSDPYLGGSPVGAQKENGKE